MKLCIGVGFVLLLTGPLFSQQQPDRETVYISHLLIKRHPEVEKGLRTALGDRLKVIPGAKDIWCRDYMPIQVSPDRFVQFRYAPDYLKGFPKLRTEHGGRLLKLNSLPSDLVIDGGNVVRCNNTAILTDKVYRENPHVAPSKLRDQLAKELEVKRLIIIPREPGDTIGHSDGMVRFVDEKTLLVNDYRQANPKFGKKLYNVLTQDGFRLIPFPYCPTGKMVDGIDSAKGIYINFLQTNELVVCPTFGMPQDEKAIRLLIENFPRHRIIPLRCEKLARKGGVLNCVTWEIRSGNAHKK